MENNQVLLIAGASFTGGLLFGGAAVYAFMRRRERRAKEIDEFIESYGEKAPEEPIADEPPQSGSYLWGLEKPPLTELKTFVDDYVAPDLPTEEERAELEHPEDDEVEVKDRDLPRTPLPPYTIPYEKYGTMVENDRGWDVKTYLYYTVDGALISDEEEIVSNAQDLFGDCLNDFYANDEIEYIYIRNENERTDYEIMKVHFSWSSYNGEEEIDPDDYPTDFVWRDNR